MTEVNIIDVSNFSIIKNKIPITNISKLLNWKTNYLYNDIFIINYDNDLNKLSCAIYFNESFHLVTILFNEINTIVESNIDPMLFNLLSQNLKNNDIYDYLNILSMHLNKINDYHDDFSFELINNNIESNYTFDFNPYAHLDIENNNTLNIHNLKEYAYKLYNENISDNKLNISPQFIVEVIIKELINIDISNYELILSNNNIFDFDIKFSSFKSKDITLSLQKNDLDGIVMNIKLDPYSYPYTPPSILFRHKFKNNLDLIICKQPYFQLNNWNITNTLIDMLDQIYIILDNNVTISEVINTKYQNINVVINSIIIHNNIYINSKNDLDLKYIKIDSNNDDSQCWKSGIGYGTEGRTDWNIKEYYENKVNKNKQNINLTNNLLSESKKLQNDTDYEDFLIKSNFLIVIKFFINEVNFVEFDNNFETYKNIINVIKKLNMSFWEKIEREYLTDLYNYLDSFSKEINTYLSLNKNDIEISSKNEILKDFISFYELISKFKKDDISNLENYCTVMKKNVIDECNFKNYFYDEDYEDSNNKHCISKLIKEISTYGNSLPISYDSSIFLKYDSVNIRKLKVLIIGPKDTPYENGCFIFDILIPHDYPEEPPKVNLQTTGNGTVRFNPNLYNNGKVCLSLLGTWSGSGGEKWNKNTSTILQILVSIQSLIFVENPYFNEPGYERLINTEKGKISNFDYNDKIQYNTIKWAINDNIENPQDEFKDIINSHFKFKKNDIIKTIHKWCDSSKFNKHDYNYIVDKCIKLLN